MWTHTAFFKKTKVVGHVTRLAVNRMYIRAFNYRCPVIFAQACYTSQAEMASLRIHKSRVSVYQTLVQARSDRIQIIQAQDVGASKRRKRKSRRKKALSDALARTRGSLDQPGAGELVIATPSFYPVVSKEFKDRVIALDCEMVGVNAGPLIKSALGRCSIVDYNGEVLFDRYVIPEGEIVDYRTAWSGITSRHMRYALPFDEALSKIRLIMDGAVVVGHDLKHDFTALELTHPPSHTRDTALYKPLRTLAELPTEHPPSLRNLAWKLAGERIQNGVHCSVEDARAVLRVYKRVEKRWEWEMNQKQNHWAGPGPSSQSSNSDHSKRVSWLSSTPFLSRQSISQE